MSQERDIIRDTVGYSSSMYFSQIIRLVQGFVTSRFLGPTIKGMWMSLSIILTYGQNSHLGTLSGMGRNIPYYIGKKDYPKVERIKNSVFGFDLVVTLFVSVIIMAVSLVLPDGSSPIYVVGLKIIAILLLLQQLRLFYTILLRSYKKFILISKAQILQACVAIILTIPLVIKFGIYGVFIATIATYIIVLFYLFKNGRFQLKFHIDRKEILSLLKTGIPILAIAFSFMVFKTIDKLMIIKFLSRAELGYYGIAIMMVGMIEYIPNVVSSVMYPRFLERYGEKGKMEYLENYIKTPTLIIAYLIPLLIGTAIILMHLPIKYILPKFIPGLAAARILLLGSFFLSLIRMPGGFLITINKLGQYLYIILFAVIIAVVLNYTFLRLGLGINGIALGTALTYLTYLVVITFYALNHFLNGRVMFLKFFVKLFIPFLYMLFILHMLDLIIPTEWSNFTNDVIFTLIKLALFSIMNIPLMYYINRETSVILTIFRTIHIRLESSKYVSIRTIAHKLGSILQRKQH